MLNGIDIDVHSGEFLGIVGPSGSGKTTLLYCLAGLLKASSGSITSCDKDILSMSSQELAVFRRDHIGFIFQNYCLIPSLNVFDNSMLLAKLKGVSVKPEHRSYMFEKLGLSEYLQKPIQQLSGGEKQRVAIARAFMATPDIIFADEPTAALDSENGKIVMELIAELQKTYATTMVLVTHDIEKAAMADRTVVLKDGVIHAELSHPSPEQIFTVMRSHD